MKKRVIIHSSLLSKILVITIIGVLYSNQQGKIFAANQNASPSCANIIGSWQWFNDGVVIIEPDGALSHKSEGGTWKRIRPQERRFVLTWKSGWIDELTLSEDGTTLDGYNQNKDHVTGQKIANSSTDIAGTYYWFNGGLIVIDSDGRLFTIDKGIWKCIDPTKPRFMLTWNSGWVDEMTLSKDGTTLGGYNQNKDQVSGQKLKLDKPQKRFALIIGNSAYKDVPLQNPIHDAEDISSTLQALGFVVTTKTNVNQQAMEDAVNTFFSQIQNSDVALFYFSGHGTQVNGENYLLPVEENIQTESDIRYKAVNAGYILGKMEESGSRTNIIILDACRNNPFKGLRSLIRGLTIMDAPIGSFIAYATAPGSVALDGTERNGIYTKYLLKVLQTKGIPIEQAFKQVLRGVEKETNGQQIPWIASSLREDFSFNP